MSEATLKAECKAAFEFFDNDKSGGIDATEFAQLSSVLGVKLASEELNNVFRDLNKSGSGRIDFGEFWAWWTASSTAAPGTTGAEVRKRLLIARGKAFLAKAFGDSVKRQVSQGATKFVLCNPVTNPQMGVSVEISPSATPLAGVLASADAADAHLALAFDFDLTSVESKPYAEALIQIVAVSAECNAPAGTRIQVVDGDSEDTLRVLVLAAGDDAADSAQTLAGLGLNFKASLQAGWSFGSLGASQFSATLLDLLNLEASATVDTLPVDVTGAIDATLEKLGAAGLPVASLENAPGLAELRAGNSHVTVDFTEAVTELLGVLGEMSPLPVDGSTSISDALSQLAPMFIMGQSPVKRRQVIRNLRVATQTAQAVRMYLSRDIRSLKAVHVQTRDGGFGASLSFLGLFSTDAFGQVVTGAVGLGRSIAESVPEPTDEEIAEWEQQQALEAAEADGEGDADAEVDAEDAGEGFNYDD